MVEIIWHGTEVIGQKINKSFQNIQVFVYDNFDFVHQNDINALSVDHVLHHNFGEVTENDTDKVDFVLFLVDEVQNEEKGN